MGSPSSYLQNGNNSIFLIFLRSSRELSKTKWGEIKPDHSCVLALSLDHKVLRSGLQWWGGVGKPCPTQPAIFPSWSNKTQIISISLGPSLPRSPSCFIWSSCQSDNPHHDGWPEPGWEAGEVVRGLLCHLSLSSKEDLVRVICQPVP